MTEAWFPNGRVKGSRLLKHGGFSSCDYFYFLNPSKMLVKNENLQGKEVGVDMGKVCGMLESEKETWSTEYRYVKYST